MVNLNRIAFQKYGTTFKELYDWEQSLIVEYYNKEQNGATVEELLEIIRDDIPYMVRPHIGDNLINFADYYIFEPTFTWCNKTHRWISIYFENTFSSLRLVKRFLKHWNY